MKEAEWEDTAFQAGGVVHGHPATTAGYRHDTPSSRRDRCRKERKGRGTGLRITYIYPSRSSWLPCTSGGGSDSMAQNVIDILKQEHEMVLSQLSELSSTGTSNREQKYTTMKKNLISHMIGGEEQAVYPKLMDSGGMKEIALESIEEHNAVKTLLSQLDSASTSEEDVWVAKITVIQENVKHHISEEEEHIFPEMQQKMSSAELLSLGSSYEEAKKSAMPMAAR
ncbi:hemerythrin domain-containing protein [Methanoculleus chikugoensis]|uniref:hemerythrin domain-containing protein n=1 Tax=Methanoculleus chikugoensis TaxID=118126 RepID=UPI001FB544C8|nr:hemerythrin domain-containing protein [Methanoculleus chikugoensis]